MRYRLRSFRRSLTGWAILPLVIAATTGCDGVRTAAPAPDNAHTLVIGQSNGEPFTELADGDDVQAFTLGQGTVHLFVSFHVTGFNPDAEVSITVSAERVEDGRVVIENRTQPETLTEIGPSLYERIDRLVRFDAFPSEIVEQDIVFTLTVTDVNAPTTTVSVTRQLHVLQPPSS